MTSSGTILDWLKITYLFEFIKSSVSKFLGDVKTTDCDNSLAKLLVCRADAGINEVKIKSVLVIKKMADEDILKLMLTFNGF